MSKASSPSSPRRVNDLTEARNIISLNLFSGFVAKLQVPKEGALPSIVAMVTNENQPKMTPQDGLLDDYRGKMVELSIAPTSKEGNSHVVVTVIGDEASNTVDGVI